LGDAEVEASQDAVAAERLVHVYELDRVLDALHRVVRLAVELELVVIRVALAVGDERDVRRGAIVGWARLDRLHATLTLNSSLRVGVRAVDVRGDLGALMRIEGGVAVDRVAGALLLLETIAVVIRGAHMVLLSASSGISGSR
ncbi:MAG TPA: hypothetical protein VK506_05825, partial [Conexibacter sp.]|nr:hypothetical protein [Conexibacter sp.]